MQASYYKMNNVFVKTKRIIVDAVVFLNLLVLTILSGGLFLEIVARFLTVNKNAPDVYPQPVPYFDFLPIAGNDPTTIGYQKYDRMYFYHGNKCIRYAGQRFENIFQEKRNCLDKDSYKIYIVGGSVAYGLRDAGDPYYMHLENIIRGSLSSLQ